MTYVIVAWSSCDKHCLNRVLKLQKRAIPGEFNSAVEDPTSDLRRLAFYLGQVQFIVSQLPGTKWREMRKVIMHVLIVKSCFIAQMLIIIAQHLETDPVLADVI